MKEIKRHTQHNATLKLKEKLKQHKNWQKKTLYFFIFSLPTIYENLARTTRL